jgi:hypothetical protein
MVAPATTTTLYSTVKNLVGVPHYFGYIGAHGRRLAAGSSYTVPGNVVDSVLNKPGYKRRNYFKAMERDLLAGRLAIEQTPSPIFIDLAPAAAVANPTVAITASNSAGSVVWTGLSGSYYFYYTWISAFGETTVGTSVIASALTLTNGTSQLQVTVPSLPSGATGVNVYASTTAGSEVFLATYATGGAKNGPANFPTFATVPSSNTATIPAPALAPAVNIIGGGSTGGLLASGAYYAKYTYTNANGETTGSPESVNFTVATGNIPALAIEPMPAGATGVNIYLTAAAGSSATEVLYASSPVPVGTTAAPSILTGYLQPGTSTDPLWPNSIYLLAVAAPTSVVTVPGSNTATIVAPEFTPLITTTTSGVPSASSIPTSIAPYLAPGFQGDVNYSALQQGGALQAGTYYIKTTYTTAAGETTGSTESNPFTVVAGQIPILQVVPSSNTPEGYSVFEAGATGLNVYLGASGSETLYLSGVTTQFVRLLNATGNSPPPTNNSTGGANIRTITVTANALGVANTGWQNGSYNSGLPVP